MKKKLPPLDLEKVGPVVTIDKRDQPPPPELRTCRTQGAKLTYSATVYSDTTSLLVYGDDPARGSYHLTVPTEDLVVIAKLCAAASGWQFDLRKP